MKFHMIAGGPKPVAPFSHAVETDGFVLVTGQMPDTPGAPGVLPEGIVGRDPIAVRVENVTIAVRRREAMAVIVA